MTVERRAATVSASARAGRPSVAAAASAMSPQLNMLAERAFSGKPEDMRLLVKWSALVEQEAQMLRRRLRKQQHDFATLFEIVGQTSVRSLDVATMQTCLLRTVSGHFATAKLLIMRRMRPEDSDLACSANQGVHQADCRLPLGALLCSYALERRFCFALRDAPKPVVESAAAQSLLDAGLELVVPLVQEVKEHGPALEGFLFLGPRLSGRPYAPEDNEFLNVLGKMLAICLRNEALYRRSIIDDLTGVASRGHFEAQLSQELNRITTYGHRSLGLIMMDIDHFKNYNDNYGHQTGDRILQEIAQVLNSQVRNVDLVARYGGEEFAVIVLEIDRTKILEVACRLRQAIEDMEVLSAQGDVLRISASFGVACFPDDATDKSRLIQLADKALYHSKDLGRNRVTMFDRPLVPLGPPLPTPAPQRRMLLDTAPNPAPVAGTRPSLEQHGVLSSPMLSPVQPDLEQLRQEQRAVLAEGHASHTALKDERRHGAKDRSGQHPPPA